MAGLCLELVLTRLMSLTLYHHFAFLAVSLALLGIAVGGVAVYAFPTPTGYVDVCRRMGWASLGFAATVVTSFVVQQHFSLSAEQNLSGLLSTTIKVTMLATPFFFVGWCMALGLRYYAFDASRVYAADLLGAGCGSLFSIGLLEYLGGIGALVALSFPAGLSAWAFFSTGTSNTAKGRWKANAWIAASLLLSLAMGSLLDLRPPNRSVTSAPLTERWNAFSRVGVYEIRDSAKALRETVSSRYAGSFPEVKFIQIDSSAGSHILNFSDGDLSSHEYLIHDITYVGFHLHDRDGKVLVIGPGGGRDVLAALLTGRQQITGIEVNPIIADLMRNEFASFSGNLWQRPGFDLVVDEARSYLARDHHHYDFIHASLACTWAATAGGAFVLTENSLYTVEAFSAYLAHLNDSGILSMTMWFRGRPGELLRLVNLGQEALRKEGVAEPKLHIAVLSHSTGQKYAKVLDSGFGTFLMKKTPFQPDELERLKQLVDLLGFKVLYAPDQPSEPEFKALLENDPHQFTENYPLDISPPSDDRPFFFYQMRYADFVPALFGNGAGPSNSDPLHRTVAGILMSLLLASTILVLTLLLIPLSWKSLAKSDLTMRSIIQLMYFALIGLGFMLVEIPLLQRLSIFLGKPIFAFSVVLFTLLTCAGIGSFLSVWLSRKLDAATHAVFLLLIILLLALILWLPVILTWAMPLPEHWRILLAMLCLAPLGVLLGLPLPIAIFRLGIDSESLIPLAWGVNGGASVLASVLAMLVSINWGLKITLTLGGACYLFAWLLWHVMAKNSPRAQ